MIVTTCGATGRGPEIDLGLTRTGLFGAGGVCAQTNPDSAMITARAVNILLSIRSTIAQFTKRLLVQTRSDLKRLAAIQNSHSATK
jgi:hypothetical protein